MRPHVSSVAYTFTLLTCGSPFTVSPHSSTEHMVSSAICTSQLNALLLPIESNTDSTTLNGYLRAA